MIGAIVGVVVLSITNPAVSNIAFPGEQGPTVMSAEERKLLGLTPKKGEPMTIIMQVTGVPGAYVHGWCATSDGRTSIIGSVVPFKQVFAADGLKCTLEANRGVIVEVRKFSGTVAPTTKDGLTRVETSGGTVTINVK
jgi:hypothetical protein